MNDEQRLAGLTKAAWDAGDIPLVDFYNRIAAELKHLRAVGAVAGQCMCRPLIKAGNDMFEALEAAGSIPESDRPIGARDD